MNSSRKTTRVPLNATRLDFESAIRAILYSSILARTVTFSWRSGLPHCDLPRADRFCLCRAYACARAIVLAIIFSKELNFFLIFVRIKLYCPAEATVKNSRLSGEDRSARLLEVHNLSACAIPTKFRILAGSEVGMLKCFSAVIPPFFFRFPADNSALPEISPPILHRIRFRISHFSLFICNQLVQTECPSPRRKPGICWSRCWAARPRS